VWVDGSVNEDLQYVLVTPVSCPVQRRPTVLAVAQQHTFTLSESTVKPHSNTDTVIQIGPVTSTTSAHCWRTVTSGSLTQGVSVMPATHAQETCARNSHEKMKNLTQVHHSFLKQQQLSGQSHCTVRVMCWTVSVLEQSCA